MKHYAVFEYAYDSYKEEFTDIKGQIKAFIDAEDPFEACEKAGLTESNRYFAEVVYDDNLKKIKEDIQKEKELLDNLDKSLNGWLGEKAEKDKICPNCEKQMNEKGECSACGYGVDEIAVGGVVVTKEMIDEMEKKAKKLAKKVKKGKKSCK